MESAMSLIGYVRQVRPIQESHVNHLDKIQKQFNLLEELSPGAELQRAIELAELIDIKVASIDAQTQLKDNNKNRITLTQVVNDKDRIKFAALAKEIIDAEENFENVNITSSRSDKDYHFRHVDVDRSIYVQL